MSEPKSKSVNIYDGLCNFIESFHYIQTVDLYDEDIYHVKLYAVEKIGHDIMNYFNKIAS